MTWFTTLGHLLELPLQCMVSLPRMSSTWCLNRYIGLTGLGQSRWEVCILRSCMMYLGSRHPKMRAKCHCKAPIALAQFWKTRLPPMKCAHTYGGLSQRFAMVFWNDKSFDLLWSYYFLYKIKILWLLQTIAERNPLSVIAFFRWENIASISLATFTRFYNEIVWEWNHGHSPNSAHSWRLGLCVNPRAYVAPQQPTSHIEHGDASPT